MRSRRWIAVTIAVATLVGVSACTLAPKPGTERNEKVTLFYVGPEFPCVVGYPDLDPVIYTPGQGADKPKRAEWRLGKNTCAAQENGKCYWEFVYDPTKPNSGDHLGAVDPIKCQGPEHTKTKLDKHPTHGGVKQWPYKISVFECVEESADSDSAARLVKGDLLCELDPRIWIK